MTEPAEAPQRARKLRLPVKGRPTQHARPRSSAAASAVLVVILLFTAAFVAGGMRVYDWQRVSGSGLAIDIALGFGLLVTAALLIVMYKAMRRGIQ